ncbi:MAG: hypothetical protein WCR05_09890, partial [Sphaerochaetaceae bacterium]
AGRSSALLLALNIANYPLFMNTQLNLTHHKQRITGFFALACPLLRTLCYIYLYGISLYPFIALPLLHDCSVIAACLLGDCSAIALATRQHSPNARILHQ